MARLNLAIILMVLATGCLTQSATNQSPPPGTTTPNSGQNTPDDSADLNPTSPNVVYANGWSQIIINANSARTAVDTGSHFTTSRNLCGREAFGAIDLEIWNKLSTNMNSAIMKPASTEENEYCVDTPNTYPYMDGTVEIDLGQGKRTIYSLKNGQICGNVLDKEVSNALLDAIHKVINTADKEDCPRGWGS